MHVAQINLTNWGPFRGEHQIDLGPGTFALTGANGAGKSAATLSMIFALFGHLPKGATAEQMVSEGESVMRVEVVLSTGDRIVRGWTIGARGKGAGHVEVTGAEDASIRDADARIRELLGVDAAELLATSFLAQGDAGALVTASQADRRDLLARWVVPACWADLHEQAKRARERAETSLSGLRGRLAGLGDPGDEDALQGELDALRAQRAELGDADADAPRLEDERAAMIAARDALAEADRIEGELPDAPDLSGLAGAEGDRDEARRKLAETEPEVRALEQLACGQFDGACPLDGVPCPRTDGINAARDEHRERLANLTRSRDMIAGLRDSAQATVTELCRQRDQHRREVARLSGAASKVDTSFDPWTRVLEAEAAGDAAERAAQIAEVDQAIGRVEASLERARTEARSRAQIADALAQQEARVAGLRWLEHASGRRGVPARIVEAAVADVVRGGNAVLAAAGSPLRFEVRTKRELKKAARFCPCGHEFARQKKCPACGAPRGREHEDDLTPLVRSGDGPARRWRSSGQAMMLALALRIGVAAWRRRKSGARLGTLVLDEFEGPLDATNAEAAHDLARRAASQLGFAQVLLVSHRPASQLSAGRVIRIEHDGSWSTIRVE